MYKKIYRQVKQLIFYPAKAWQEIDDRGYDENVQNDYLFPLIAVGTLAIVLGQIWTKTFDFQLIIRIGTIIAIAYLGGFFSSVYLLKSFIEKKYKKATDLKRIMSFVAYSSTVMLVINIFVGLIPTDIFFLKIFNIYTAYIVAQGSFILDIEDEEQNSFVIVATAIILFCPFAIEQLMTLMMPGMKQ
jgi:hypothetical protein